MFDWLKFKSKSSDYSKQAPLLTTDVHSHLLPGIDDGAEDISQSVAMIRQFASMGYLKLVTTPHIMGDFYKNTPSIIKEKLETVKNALAEAGIDIHISAAAEYYLDESFTEKINNGEPLLTFGDNYLLFETSYMNEPALLNETIFQLKAAGYQPILAHPERYVYLFDNFKRLEQIYATGVLFQVNALSFEGYYSPNSKKIAEKLVQAQMIDLIGSDCHKIKHLQSLQNIISQNKYYRKALDLNLINRSL